MRDISLKRLIEIRWEGQTDIQVIERFIQENGLESDFLKLASKLAVEALERKCKDCKYLQQVKESEPSLENIHGQLGILGM